MSEEIALHAGDDFSQPSNCTTSDSSQYAFCLVLSEEIALHVKVVICHSPATVLIVICPYILAVELGDCLAYASLHYRNLEKGRFK